jgi:hypothetical protein
LYGTTLRKQAEMGKAMEAFAREKAAMEEEMSRMRGGGGGGGGGGGRGASNPSSPSTAQIDAAAVAAAAAALAAREAAVERRERELEETIAARVKAAVDDALKRAERAPRSERYGAS